MTPDQLLTFLARSPRVARLFSHAADRLFPDALATYPALLGPGRGLRFYLNARSQTSLLFGTYENQSLHFLLAYLTPESVFWDIGANVGYFTCVAARRLLRGQVVAVEPLPANVEAIERHLRLNRLVNVTLVKQALAAESGQIPFVVAHNSSMGYLAPDNASSPATILVSVTTLDALVQAGHPPPTLIKMDTEGAEGRILAGASEVLSHSRPTCLIEVHTPEAAEQCWAHLQAHRYRVRVLEGSRPVPATSPLSLCGKHAWAEPLL